MDVSKSLASIIWDISRTLNPCVYRALTFLKRRKDFKENDHYNIAMRHNGIESFKDSNFPFGISKKALNHYGWTVTLDSYGFILVNSDGEQIGRHEYYYGLKEYGGRNITNQPLLQRWIIKREALERTATGEHLPIGVLFDTITIDDNDG